MTALAFQWRKTATGKLRVRLVEEHSTHEDYWIVPLTRWCATVENARLAFRRPRGKRQADPYADF